MKTAILNRVNAKSENTTQKQVATTGKEIDPNSPASPRLTYALYQANRAASKIDGCKVFNDWHKQGLTVKECNDLIATYNKVTGYVYNPKIKAEKPTKNSPKKRAVLSEHKQTSVRGEAKPAKKGITTTTESKVNDKLAGQIEALKEMRREGLLTPAELVDCLKGLQV